MQKGQIGVIEDFEEFIPFDFFQIVFRLAEVNPQDSAFAALGADHCRTSVTLLCPSADLVMICGLDRLTHCLLHSCWLRSEEHTSELQSLMRISYAVFCLKKQIIYKQST